MNEKYQKSAKALNEVTFFFATEGYHTETTFLSHHMCMSTTIYFNEITDKTKIEHLLNVYAEDKDKIVYHEHQLKTNLKYYTLTLHKYPS